MEVKIGTFDEFQKFLSELRSASQKLTSKESDPFSYNDSVREEYESTLFSLKKADHHICGHFGFNNFIQIDDLSKEMELLIKSLILAIIKGDEDMIKNRLNNHFDQCANGIKERLISFAKEYKEKNNKCDHGKDK